MAKHIVICRCCKQKFDAQIEDKDKIWVMPSKNYYYHKIQHSKVIFVDLIYIYQRRICSFGY